VVRCPNVCSACARSAYVAAANHKLPGTKNCSPVRGDISIAQGASPGYIGINLFSPVGATEVTRETSMRTTISVAPNGARVFVLLRTQG